MPWHYHDPFFQETPAVFKADLDEPLQEGRSAGAVPRLLRRHRSADRPRHRRTATCTRRARASTPSAPTSTATATCACWPTSCRTISGCPRCCTSSAIRSTAPTTTTFPQTLPYVLRLESHILTTEGVAMMFERLSQAAGVAGKDGRPSGGSGTAFDEAGDRDVALPAADLLALVPGDAALREGHVRESRSGFEQVVVGPGREISDGAAARRPQGAGLRQQDSHRRWRRSTTTIT